MSLLGTLTYPYMTFPGGDIDLSVYNVSLVSTLTYPYDVSLVTLTYPYDVSLVTILTYPYAYACVCVNIKYTDEEWLFDTYRPKCVYSLSTRRLGYIHVVVYQSESGRYPQLLRTTQPQLYRTYTCLCNFL